MENFGRSITIHLIDGTVTGIRTSEIGNHNILSIACPRKRIKELKEIMDSKGYIELKESGKAEKPGIYFLFGEDENGERKVYIGEGEDVFDRIDQQRSKDFWGEAIIFISTAKNLTKSHIRYLESRAIEIAKNIARDYIIENDNQTKQSTLHPAHRDDMEEFLIDIKLLLGVFGHKVLEEIITEQKEVSHPGIATPKTATSIGTLRFSINTRELSAYANLTDEGLVVLQNSEAKKESVESMESQQTSYFRLREKLILEGILVLKDNKYIFQKNYLFNSPSAAAAVVLGRSANGRTSWKDDMGRTLKYLEENE